MKQQENGTQAAGSAEVFVPPATPMPSAGTVLESAPASGTVCGGKDGQPPVGQWPQGGGPAAQSASPTD